MGWLALDVGTSGVKAAVLDEATGQPIAPVEKRSYALEQPVPHAMVIDPERLHAAVLDAARVAVRNQSVHGIGFSVFTPGLILLKADLQPLTPIITHLDRRARLSAKRVWQDCGDAFLNSNGNKPLPGGISALVWQELVQQSPEWHKQVRYFLHLNSWLALQWTGQTAFDPGNACFTGLTEWRSPRQWSAQWCDYFQIQLEWLPPIKDGSHTVGELRNELVSALGLPRSIPVKIGFADTSSAVCAAQLQLNEVLHVVGTTQVLACRTTQPVPSPSRLMRPLGLGNDFLHVAHNPVGGVALEWLYRLCFADVTESTYYADLLFQAMSRSTHVRLDPPYLGGDRLEIDARYAGLQNLSLSTDRMDVLIAVLQAMREGHKTAWHAMQFESNPHRIVLTGGGDRWVKRLLPEYTNVQVQMLEQASLLGVWSLFSAR